MKPANFLKWLEESEDDGIVTLSPGPFKVIAGAQDRIAAKLLRWLQDEYPLLTIGGTEDALLTALWWVQFWAGVQHCDDAGGRP